MNYNTKDLKARRKRELTKQIDLTLTNGDLLFVTNFIQDSGFYIEHLESHIGESLHDFWQTREHAMRILTNWMMQAMEEPLHMNEPAAMTKAA
ncbi:MAG TPA: hypothetical protein VEW28_10585 [Candidatus Kapabacteria bacterium]|nr:hypothetical protein [Candidatus Kapabacteria bacterium]HYM33921.1 hypothetical protein [Steroidobacteraceae bacterium]